IISSHQHQHHIPYALSTLHSPHQIYTLSHTTLFRSTLNDLVAPSIRLCKALNYRGMAEIEYKRDINTGEYKLIEINTRHWDWHRSEEHTSELQSRSDLVCRLLLEKKKNQLKLSVTYI